MDFLRSQRSSSRVPPVPEGLTLKKENVYELYAPSKGVDTELEVVFVHGLHPSPDENRGSHKTAFWETWLTTPLSPSTQPELWPRTWLAEKFPTARILSLATSPPVDLPGQCLLEPLMLAGCGMDTPVVMVGHCFGGILIKQIVLQAKDLIDNFDHDEKSRSSIRRKNFLRNLKGFFFFSTPHHGSEMMDKLPSSLKSLWPQMTVQSKDGSQLNGKFKEWIRDKPNVAVYNVFEDNPTTITFNGRAYTDYFVSEASVNSGGDESYPVIGADHFSICKPRSREDSQFQLLVKFIAEQTGVALSNRPV